MKRIKTKRHNQYPHNINQLTTNQNKCEARGQGGEMEVVAGVWQKKHISTKCKKIEDKI